MRSSPQLHREPLRNDPAPTRLTLEATNKTGAVPTIPVKFKMTSMSIASMVSRTPMKPKDVWSYDRELILKPGQSE